MDYTNTAAMLDSMRLHFEHDAETRRAAVRTVLWRVENAGLSPVDAYVCLSHAGLLETAREMQAEHRARETKEAS